MQQRISHTLRNKVALFLGSENLSYKKMPGAYIHEVYEVKDGDGSVFVLKIRGNVFAGNANLKLLPQDILFEATVLQKCKDAQIEGIPNIVKYFEEENAILMEYMAPQNSNLLELLNSKTLKVSDYKNISSSLSDLLTQLNETKLNVSKDIMNENFIKRNLVFRVNRHKLTYVDEFVKKSESFKRYYICGDFSPKNIFMVDKEVRVCDLDRFQTAPVEFDIYFLLAHIILHNITNPELIAIVKSFQEGLCKLEDKIQFSTSDIITYILLTMIYRLDNEEIQYPICTLSEANKNKLLLKVYFVLSNGHVFQSVSDLITYLVKHEESEIEAKILEVDKSQIIESLIKSGVKITLDDTTTIESFEAPDVEPQVFSDVRLDEMIKHLKFITSNFTKKLDETGAYLRIRKQGREREFTLKYKINTNDNSYKVEKEINVSLEDDNFFASIRMWLEENKFIKISNLVKQRTSFASRQFGTQVDIDSWLKPTIPTYIEIEGFDQRSIEATAVMLGFESSALTSISGKELFKKYNVKRGL